VLCSGDYELLVERRDRVAHLLVLSAHTPHAVAQPRLVSGHVGEQAVDLVGIVLFFDGRLAEHGERGAHVVQPAGLVTGCGRAQRGFEAMDRGERAVLVGVSGLEAGALGWDEVRLSGVRHAKRGPQRRTSHAVISPIRRA
jgi:hypothetical protein